MCSRFYQNSILEQHYSLKDLWRAKKSIVLNDFKNFSKTFLERLYIKSLFEGNVKSEHATEILTGLLNQLMCEKIPDVSLFLLLVTFILLNNFMQYFRCP